MKTVNRVAVVAVSGVLLGMLGLVAGCSKQPAGSPVERGQYLATVGGCNDCHTPKVFTAAGPEFDTNRLLSGHPAGEKLPELPMSVIGPDQWGAVANHGLTAWVGPWGVSFAANLTPDATGLASWTAETFIQAMRTGKHAGVGRPILPPMPWFSLKDMPEEDLKALFAYLQSIPPIANEVPQPIPPVAASD